MAEVTIRARLDSTAIGWNRGDLAIYMNMYDEDASQMGANGVEHGRGLIEQGMRAGFWKTGRPLQSLSYEDIRREGAAKLLAACLDAGVGIALQQKRRHVALRGG